MMASKEHTHLTPDLPPVVRVPDLPGTAPSSTRAPSRRKRQGRDRLEEELHGEGGEVPRDTDNRPPSDYTTD